MPADNDAREQRRTRSRADAPSRCDRCARPEILARSMRAAHAQAIGALKSDGGGGRVPSGRRRRFFAPRRRKRRAAADESVTGVFRQSCRRASPRAAAAHRGISVPRARSATRRWSAISGSSSMLCLRNHRRRLSRRRERQTDYAVAPVKTRRKARSAERSTSCARRIVKSAARIQAPRPAEPVVECR